MHNRKHDNHDDFENLKYPQDSWLSIGFFVIFCLSCIFIFILAIKGV